MGPLSPALRALNRLGYAKSTARKLTKEERRIYLNARRSARRRGIEFTLTEEEFSRLIARAEGKCELTRISFSDEKISDNRIHPFRMSLDRLDSKGIYEVGNLVLVVVRLNLARGNVGIDEIAQILFEFARRHGAVIPQELIISMGPDRYEY